MRMISNEIVVVRDSAEAGDPETACHLEVGRLDSLMQTTGSEWHGCGGPNDPVWVMQARRPLSSIYSNASGRVVGPDVPRDFLGTVGGLRSVMSCCRVNGPGDDLPVSVPFGNFSSSVTRATAPEYTEFSAARAFYGWFIKLAYQALSAQAPTITITTENHNTIGGMPIDRNVSIEFAAFPPSGAVFLIFLPAARPVSLGATGLSGTWAPFPGVFGGDDDAPSRVSVTGLTAGAGVMSVEWLHPDSIQAGKLMVAANSAFKLE